MSNKLPDVTDIISRDAIQDLWGIGFTVVRRQRDLYEVPESIIPRDMFYQWINRNDVELFKKAHHWHEVPAERHPGMFAPWTQKGEIEVGGLVLMEKDKTEVDAQRAADVAQAHQNDADWIKKNIGEGMTGEIKIVHQTIQGLAKENDQS